MNKKLLIVAALAVLATACTPKQIIKTEYVERKVPVNSVPQPPKVEKPQYVVPTLTPEQRKDIGLFGHAIVEDDKRKDGYIAILEAILNKYKEAADKSELQTILIVPGVNDKDAKPQP